MCFEDWIETLQKGNSKHFPCFSHCPTKDDVLLESHDAFSKEKHVMTFTTAQ